MINSPFSIFSWRTSHTGCSLTIIYAARPKLLLLRFFVQNSCCHLTGSIQFAALFFSQNISCLTGISPSPAGTSPPAHYTVPPFSIPPACHSRHTSADMEHIPALRHHKTVLPCQLSGLNCLPVPENCVAIAPGREEPPPEITAELRLRDPLRKSGKQEL